MTGFFPALGEAVVRLRWGVLAFWIVFVGVSLLGAKGVFGAVVSGGIEVPGSESERGNKVLEQEFNRRPGRSAAAIFTSSRFVVEDPQYRDSVTRAVDSIKGVEGVEEVLTFYSTGSQRLVSEDRHTTYAVINLTLTEEEAKKKVPDLRDALHSQPSDLDKAYIIGSPASAYDLSRTTRHDLETAELYSLPLTIFLLLLVFGTLIAAGLPIILGAAAVVTAFAGLYLVAQRMDTSVFAINTASMIGLGLGIDFSLLMVSRYREELARGLTPDRATVRTVATAGQSIVLSGLTVMLGLSVMLLYELVLVRSIALGMLMVAGLAMLGAVTLLPALLCLFGRRVNSLAIIPGRKIQVARPSTPGRWHAWSLTVMRYPWVFLLLSAGFLVGLGIPTKDMYAIGSGGAQSVAPEMESRLGFELLSSAFPIGEISPIAILIRSNQPNGAFDPAIKEGIWRLTRQLEGDSRAARVESLATVNRNFNLEQFKALTPEQLTADPRVKANAAQYVNIDGGRDVQHVSVVSNFRDTDRNTTDLLKQLRETIVPGIGELRGTEILVTGGGAQSLDYRDELFGQFPILIGLVLLVTYVVLVLFFHSLLLPLKAILMNMLSILASYGFMVMVFQWGILDDILGFEHFGRLTMFPPVILFSILFGLSTDYEVFLLSRVKEIYKKTHDNEQSVAEGLEHTAGIITAAGLLMIVIFGSFALADALVIKELGVGLAVAVFLDSTIIRVMLVPASMKLMGHLNWWMPKALDWIPEISEGAEPEEPVRAPRPAAAGALPCRRCGATLPPRARFCGRCGTALAPSPAVAAPALAPALVGPDGGGETLMTGGFALERPAAHAAGPGMLAGMPGGGTGHMRVPIVLRIGNVQRQAWLTLRDCQVERDPSSPGVPIVAVEGIEVLPLQGRDPPEIQVRNARIRL